MTKKITWCYILLGSISIIFLLYIGCNFRNEKYEVNASRNACECLDFETVKEDDEEIILKYTLPIEVLDNVSLGFQSLHQSVKVYVGDVLIYSLSAGDNAFGKTTGWAWNFVKMHNSYQGKELIICLDSIYGKGSPPVVYMDEELDLYMMIIRKNMVPFVICIFTMLIGIGMIGYWIYVHKKTEVGNSLLHLGTFALVLGIWSVNELPVIMLIFRGNVAFSYLAFVALMFLPVPFILFVKDLYLDQNNKWWYIISCLSLLDISVCVGMQVLNILDMRESLYISHVTLMIMVVVVIWMTIKEMRNGQLNYKIKVNVACVGIDMFTLFLDLTLYYLKDGDSNTFGRIGFLIHIVALGWLATRDSASLMEKGRVAELYETLAYRDQLTGLANRTAFVEDLEKRSDQEKNTSIIMLDLNDLKRCNDTLGHEAGDNYIKNASKIIDAVFRENGKCYRIGGDEFCVILPSNSKKLCKALMSSLQDRQKWHNAKFKEEKIYIAMGYAAYDGSRDKDLNDTRNRADAMMYENKQKMKNETYRKENNL